MKTKHLISAVLALLLACSLPVTALAAEYDLAEGSVTVIATESGQTVTHGSNAAVPDDAPVIVQSNSSETPTANTVTIKAEENATANVTLDGVNIDTRGTDKAAVEIQGEGDVVIELDGSNTVQSDWNRAGVEKNTRDPWGTNPGSGNGNLTITDENETHGSLKATGGSLGAGIGGGNDRSGSNITITGNAEVTAQGGHGAAGIGGSDDNDGRNITISGNAEVIATGGSLGAGIGGGCWGSGSDITITGSAEVTAQGGVGGAGIGGGLISEGNALVSNITVSEDARVKTRGGDGGESFGLGAAIGYGGGWGTNGTEVTPDTDELTPNGRIEYYAPGANMSTDDPYKTVTGTYVPPQPEEPAQPARPLYRVIDPDGKTLDYKAERKDGVLTITAEADFAALTGTLGGIRTLKAQGIDTIVFVTNGATSTFALSDLLAQGGDGYTLTHDGAAVTFTMTDGADVSKILQ